MGKYERLAKLFGDVASELRRLDQEDQPTPEPVPVPDPDPVPVPPSPPTPGGPVFDTGRKNYKGEPVYKYSRNGGRSMANNASGDINTVSGSGRYLAVQDGSRSNRNVAIDLKTMEAIDMVPFGFDGGTNEFPQWFGDHLMVLTKNKVTWHHPNERVSDLAEFSLPYNSWRTGISHGDQAFIYAGDKIQVFQRYKISGEDHHRVATAGSYSLRDKGGPAWATRIHNPHPMGRNQGWATSIKGAAYEGQKRLFLYDWLEGFRGELIQPLGEHIIHPTFNSHGAWAGTQNGHYDGKLIAGDMRGVELRDIRQWDLRDAIEPHGVYKQYQHGQLLDDGTLLFSVTHLKKGSRGQNEIWCQGIYRVNVETDGRPVQVVAMDTRADFGNSFAAIPRPSGGNGWVSWTEGGASYNVHFCRY